MRLHLPLCLLSAVLACYATNSVVHADTWDDGTSTFSNSDPAVVYDVSTDGSYSLGVKDYTNTPYTYSTGLNISQGVNFTLYQNSANNGAVEISLGGTFTGSGTLVLVTSNGSADIATRFYLTNTESNFTGNVVLIQRNVSANNGGAILQLTGDGFAGATFDLTGSTGSSTSDDVSLEINGTASIAGLSDPENFTGTHRGRVQASGSSSVSLTLTGDGTYNYGGTIGSTASYVRPVAQNSTAAPTGAITLVHFGTGTQTLTGATINAALEVSAGTLELNNSSLTFTKSATISGGNLKFTGATIGDGFSLTSSGGTTTFSSLAGWNGTHSITASGGTIDFGNQSLSSNDTLSITGDVSINNTNLTGASVSVGETGKLTLTGTTFDAFSVTLGNDTTAKITDTSYTSGNVSLALSTSDTTVGGTYIIFQGSDSLTDLSNFTITYDLGRGLSLANSGAFIEGGALKVTLNGSAQGALNLVWAGTADNSEWKADDENLLDWTNATGGGSEYFTEGDNVTFGDDATSKDVEISGTVTPSTIQVISSSDYTFIGTGSIAGSGSLTKTGTGTLTISNANSNFSGSIALNEGTLVMNNANALGLGTLSFNGGTLKYGDGITTDISSQISTTGTGPIKVDLGTNSAIVWNWSGLGATATSLGSLGIEKSGSGTLTVTLPSGTATTYAGSITVREGSLIYQTTSVGNARTFSGAIIIAEGASLQITDVRALNDKTKVITVSGAVSGSGSLTFGVKSSSTNYPGGGMYLISGNNSTFEGVLTFSGNSSTDNWNRIELTTTNAVGSGTWVLDGKNFYFNAGGTINADVVVKEGTSIKQDGGSTHEYIYSKGLSGSGSWGYANDVRMQSTFTGNLQGFTGSLKTSETTTASRRQKWIFGNGGEYKDTNGTTKIFGDGATLAGNTGSTDTSFAGIYTVNYSDASLILNATVLDNSSLVYEGAGTLILDKNNTATGALTISNGTVQLGDGTDSAYASWLGSIAGAGNLVVNTGANAFTVQSADQLALTGTVTLEAGKIDLNGQAVTHAIVVKNGTLDNASAYATEKGVTIDSVENAAITLNGLSSASIGSVSLAEGATLTYTGDATLDLSKATVSIVVGADQVAEIPDGSSAADVTTTPIITAAAVKLAGASTTLTLSNEAIVDTFKAVKSNDTQAKLTISSGDISFSDSYAGLSVLFGGSNVLTGVGLSITDTDGGSLIIGGSTDDVWLVTSDTTKTDPDSITEYATLDPYKAVVLDAGQTLTAELDGARTDNNGDGLLVKNLVGVETSTLKVTNTDTTGTAIATVVLDNSSVVPSTDPDAELADGTEVTIATDTTMEGAIVGGDNVAFLKQGEGTLTVTGSVDVDTLQAQEGSIALNGTSTVDSLVLDSAGSSTATVAVGGALTTTLSDDNNGGELKVTDKGTVTLADTSSLTKSSISGDGTLVINNATLALSEDATLDGTKVVLQTGKLYLGEDATTTTTAGTTNARTTALLAAQADKSYSVKSLNGDSASTIKLADATLTVNGTGTSTYSGEIEGQGTLDVQNGTVNINNSGSEKVSLVLTKATVTLNATGASSTKALRAASTGSISYDGIVLNSGSTLSLGSSDATGQTLSIGSGGITLNSGAKLVFNTNYTTDDEFFAMSPLATTTGAIALNSGSTVALSNSTALVSADEETFKVTLMKGATATVNSASVEADFLSTVYENLALSVENGTDVVLSGTARATSIFESAELTPNATSGSNLLWKSRFALAKTGESTLKDAYLAVSDMVSDGDKAGAARTMAAIAGSTVNALGTAQRDALQNQMGWIRNRTVTMGVSSDYTYDDLPYVHMWIEGTGATAKLSTSGDEGGYKMNSWGGTVGFDADLTEHFTLGAALSAQYGSLSSSAAEYATGDLDSYYVSVFGRYQKSAWAHTVILTGSFTDATLDRTVNYGTGTYKTIGDTDGSGFGAMYELTYDMPLNEDKSRVFQPLFNASIVNTTMKAYDETGAGNAGLNVGKQDWTTATLALGARWMGLVGTNVFGREALLEVRANIAQDLGDDQGETRVALNARPDFTQTVYGAKVGKTAGQFGVGLYLPVGQQGTVFVNGNADVRSGAHSFNGSLGYRYSF